MRIPAANWARLKEGTVAIGDKPVRFPDLDFVREVGRGANAVVFEATDKLLDRRVAVKIWNARGVSRAQAETAKIAQLSHPLIVSTYLFGRVDDHPYAVMELIAGSSGKEWLKRSPSVAARGFVWRLYSRALRFIHSQDAVHGDPHLGNILVFPDPTGIYGDSGPFGEAAFSIKVADAGTSIFWPSRASMLKRETSLIFETATRLFHDQRLDALWTHPKGLSHQNSLKILDNLCRYIENVNGLVVHEARGQNAQLVVDMMVQTPLFDIDTVVSQIRATGYTTTNRLARRLNQRLFKIYDLMEASDEIGEDTRRAYSAARRAFVSDLAK